MHAEVPADAQMSRAKAPFAVLAIIKTLVLVKRQSPMERDLDCFFKIRSRDSSFAEFAHNDLEPKILLADEKLNDKKNYIRKAQQRSITLEGVNKDET